MGNIFSFDVVIPLYNKALSVKKTLESVLSQNEIQFNNIIIINDGSTDDSLKIINEIKIHNNHRKIKIISQQNRGVSYARNIGIKQSRKFGNSKFITLLDSDDILSENYLVEINKLIDKYYAKENCYIFSTTHVNFYGEYLKVKQNKLKQKILRYPLFAYTLNKKIVCSSGITLDTDFLQNYSFPEGINIGEDIYIWEKMFLNFKIAISYNTQIQINKNAENRSINISHQFPYYLKKYSELKKESKSFLSGLSLMIFHVTSLISELYKFKNSKQLNQNVIQEIIEVKKNLNPILLFLIDNKIIEFIYSIYFKTKKN